MSGFQDDATYLGDGAYARWEAWGDLVVYTSNGVETTNTIVFEPSALKALEAFIRRSRDARPSDRRPA